MENIKINLCDSCINKEDFPTCSNDVGFGNGLGNDNIITCSRYIKQNTKDCIAIIPTGYKDGDDIKIVCKKCYMHP